MRLFYNNDDTKILDQRRLRQFFWLDDIGAVPIQEARQDDRGYLFAANRGAGYYRQLVRDYPNILFVADFARDTAGQWHFLEADPGSFAGTGHEAVYKAVALRLLGEERRVRDDHGGTFTCCS